MAKVVDCILKMLTDVNSFCSFCITDPFVLASYSSSMHAVMYNPAEPRLLATANAKEGLGLWDIRKPRRFVLFDMGVAPAKGGHHGCGSYAFLVVVLTEMPSYTPEQKNIVNTHKHLCCYFIGNARPVL